jgi:hypothetical protein
MELTDYHFISTKTLLNFTRNRVITMLDVKRSEDIPHAIQSLIKLEATNRTFLEISPFNILNVASKVLRFFFFFFFSSFIDLSSVKAPGFDQVFYLANTGHDSELELILSLHNTTFKNRAFSVEFGNYLYFKF